MQARNRELVVRQRREATSQRQAGLQTRVAQMYKPAEEFALR
jgi:hypothetical protein